MNEVNRAIASRPAAPRLDEAGLEVGLADVLIALVTFAAS